MICPSIAIFENISPPAARITHTRGAVDVAMDVLHLRLDVLQAARAIQQRLRMLGKLRVRQTSFDRSEKFMRAEVLRSRFVKTLLSRSGISFSVRNHRLDEYCKAG